ncbi:YigZ family protein [Aeromicrobium piscarium]|uniref:YigZ family protein n=1 Tax=Aeromicrobium piscarium TaxID=2590901 RepID=A0A554RMR2_9ACTN|nr:YigZ family protein [Aeromicrobium piscarium]
MRSYRTLGLAVGNEAQAEIEVKRSRFLACVRRVQSEDDARSTIEEIRGRHRDARHHCTAFVIGPRADLQRSNDDGEPSGTAGRPILEVLNGHGLSDLVAVVTRWFGGTLLGAGGLVRAYGDATAAALDVAGTRERRLLDIVRVQVPMNEAGPLEHRLRQAGEVIDAHYDERVTYRVATTDADALTRDIAAWSAGAVQAESAGSLWRDIVG